MFRPHVFFLAAAVALSTSMASAAPTTFFGVDVNPIGNPNLTAQPNSDAARDAFFANLMGVGTETFNSFSEGTVPPLAISFGSAGTATITGSAVIETGVTSSNQYGLWDGTEASPYLNTSTGSFAINFSSPIAAFGFYGIDLESTVALNLTDVNNVTSTLTLPSQVSSSLNSGSIIYFGFYDTADTYTKITIDNPTSGSDIYAFDNFSIGSAEQVIPVNPVTVAEPFSIALLCSGLAGVGLVRRRKS